MVTNKKIVFIDSDAFVALAKSDDANHAKATKLLEHLLSQSLTFITSNYVFAETVTVISMRIGHNYAIEFIKNLKAEDSEFEIKWVDETIEETAIEIFYKQTSKNTSFVDCTNMAFLKRLHADIIFSFDEVYRKNGFKTVENQ
jgi:predicted nucleic acid-binding protein